MLSTSGIDACLVVRSVAAIVHDAVNTPCDAGLQKSLAASELELSKSRSQVHTLEQQVGYLFLGHHH
jgi:hypothetical protein